MNIWKILGIEETKNKKAITRAYREQLTVTNPEEKPEEFKQLRAAYEEALRLANTEEVIREKTPVELWTDQLDSLYRDLRARNNTEAWKYLLSQEICMALDTKPLIEEAMIRYFLQHFMLSREVWNYLNEQFDFLNRIDELMEKYPADFVENVIIAGVRNDEYLPLELFVPGIDGMEADEYRMLYVKLRQTELGEIRPVIEQLSQLREHHPYGDAYISRVMLRIGDEDSIHTLEQLHERYPGNLHLSLDLAGDYLYTENYDKGLELCESLLKVHEDDLALMRIQAQCYAGLENYQKASDIVNEMTKLCAGDATMRGELNELRKDWNEKLIEQYEQKMQETSCTQEEILSYAWACLQNDHYEKADKASELLEYRMPDPFSYHNLLGAVADMMDRVEEAMLQNDLLIEVIRNMKPDGTKKTADRIGRLAEMLQRSASYEIRRNDYEKANRKILEALNAKPGNAEILTYAVQMYIAMKEYEKAGMAADQLTEVLPDSHHSWLLKAAAYTELSRDAEAFDAVNRAMDYNSSELYAYILKLRILIRNNAWEAAEDLVKFLNDNGIEDNEMMLWARARIAFRRDQKAEEALAFYRQADAKIAEEKPSWAGDFYWEMAACLADVKDAQKDYSRNDIIAVLDKGLEKDPDSLRLMDYKAWLIAKDGRTEEAIALYRTIEEKGYVNTVAKELARLYYRNLSSNAEEALHYYEIAAQADETDPDHWFYIGMCNFRLHRLEQAAAAFLREQEMAPEDPDGYTRLAEVLMYEGRTEEALVQAQKGVDLVVKSGNAKNNAYSFAVLLRALRRLKKWDEAVDLLRKQQELDPERNGYNKRINEIYMESGQFDKAKKHLKAWRTVNRDRGDVLRAEMNLMLAKEEFVRASLLKLDILALGDPIETARITALLNLSNRSFKGLSEAERLKVEDNRKNGGDPSYSLCPYAVALAMEGRQTEADAAALECLETLQKQMKEHTNSGTLYLCRKANCLAVLGRFEEALALIEEAKKAPKCDFCSCCGCKDAYSSEANIYILMGEYDKAREVMKEFAEICAYDDEMLRNELYIRAKKSVKLFGRKGK